ncbi:MAG: PilT/PilU family type 4a pilus ATPase [Candidatus Omnitrophica bacterium]|nr:PilT/PilU family type 4a pilus ATPase [Candidatus Omnitrophota bacterium]MBU1923737.1 PilT/PilU family type 4a pilus ATPase [Candidatus Omnitrophota bacterium]
MAAYGEDRRESYRTFLNTPFSIEITDSTNKTTNTKTLIIRDISETGVYFKSDDIFSLGTECKVKFQLPNNDYIINATIKIIRIETLGLGEFDFGACFSSISEIDKDRIKKFVERTNIKNLLELVIKRNASDLHLLANQSPIIRVNGELEPLIMEQPFTPEEIKQLLYSLMNKQQIRIFEKEKELDFGMQYNLKSRFRVNLHQQRGFLEATFRLINAREFSYEELNIPEVVKDLTRQREGLILITGPTGSGKSTTMAAMVDLINHERKAVIVTLERPIEYVHANIKSIIKQREIGIDTNSFSAALKSTLRQDPNIIVVGELDDLDTISTAFVAAEAGYLVIASFHAPNAIQAIDRLANTFPTEHRKKILNQLSICLNAVIVQLLIPKTNKKGRVLASEVLIVNDAVKRNIRKDELIQISSIIQTGKSFKMQTMSESIRKAYENGIIDGTTLEYYMKEDKDHYE